MGTTERDLLATAEAVAAEAATLAETTRATAIRDVGTKSTRTDVVTAADRAAEDLIRTRLADLRPGDAFLGEESGATAGDGVTWVVDPIDGTVNYLYGYPWYAVSVAAQVGGTSVAGVVVEPATGRRWTAVKGEGAWLDGHPLRVNEPDSLAQSLLATGFPYSAPRRAAHGAVVARLLDQVRDIRRGGSAALDLCAVAAGWLDAYCERGTNPWDWAAGALIAAEAGAQVTLPGEDPELGPDTVLAAAPTIATDLRQALITAGIATYP
ncbi:inositol monophosphatase family protein [Actinokineospora bangkokensis]|uniref:Inositol-1-monophosphatase n=1 Tax=Actinokineospora bangkokensis TaxID=1193682 RepID=A0A1Q9LGA4_9PSEU|nr:inositol monophosphatase family protein [Actinokineospora bangkokensis]OLR91077.1 inositol monophosphatase [Actinokineospora bangkokensis]OLR94936.1 inositol monophosphatase [Actinokineospora bangkokensis]